MHSPDSLYVSNFIDRVPLFNLGISNKFILILSWLLFYFVNAKATSATFYAFFHVHQYFRASESFALRRVYAIYIYTHTHILSWMNNETGMKLASFFTLENYSGILGVSVTGFVTGDYDRRFEKKLQSIPQSNPYSII